MVVDTRTRTRKKNAAKTPIASMGRQATSYQDVDNSSPSDNDWSQKAATAFTSGKRSKAQPYPVSTTMVQDVDEEMPHTEALVSDEEVSDGNYYEDSEEPGDSSFPQTIPEPPRQQFVATKGTQRALGYVDERSPVFQPVPPRTHAGSPVVQIKTTTRLQRHTGDDLPVAPYASRTSRLQAQPQDRQERPVSPFGSVLLHLFGILLALGDLIWSVSKWLWKQHVVFRVLLPAIAAILAFFLVKGLISFFESATLFCDTKAQAIIHLVHPTSERDAFLNFHDSQKSPSHILAQIVNQHLQVVVTSGGDVSNSQSVVLPQRLPSHWSSSSPISITPVRNASGHYDLEVTVGDWITGYYYVHLVNTGKSFVVGSSASQ